MKELGRLVRRLRIRLGILTISDEVIVQSVDLAQSLAVLSHAIANRR